MSMSVDVIMHADILYDPEVIYTALDRCAFLLDAYA